MLGTIYIILVDMLGPFCLGINTSVVVCLFLLLRYLQYFSCNTSPVGINGFGLNPYSSIHMVAINLSYT